jgi:excinuclease ABC subunit A
MSIDWIVVSGCRQHNLKNITVRIPRGKMTVITGLSGSGKSSLAFDTLYAEGQRRYVESLSAYARQFLDRMQKPDVDYIEGLSPAISIEQRTAGGNPRSTVATATEVHDYLRLLFASIGTPHCPKCAKTVSRQSAEGIVDLLTKAPNRTRVVLLAPLIRGRKGRHEGVFESARKNGFVRVMVDGAFAELDNPPELDAKRSHSIEVVVDRLIITSRIRSRLTDSVELALKHGNGMLVAMTRTEASKEDDWQSTIYSEKFACTDCGISFEELSPRHFSFNSHYGACPTCAGLGTSLFFDTDLIIPDASLSISDGAIHAWRRGGRRLIMYYNRVLRSLAKHYAFSLDTPFKDLPSKLSTTLLNGSGDESIEFGFWRGGAHRTLSKPFEGILPNLARRYAETDSDLVRQRLRGYMNRQLCADCKGARLKPEVLACTIDDQNIADATGMSIRDALTFFGALQLTDDQQVIVKEVLKEILERLSFMADVGLGYLTLDRESGTLSGGEEQRIRLATQIGSGLTGVLYVLDEPTIGLHSRDNRRLLDALKNLRDRGNTVVIVEHDADTIRAADYIVDLGPGAGRHGGEVVCQGSLETLLADTRSLTAHYLKGDTSINVPRKRLKPTKEHLEITGASENNLKNLTVRIPLGLFVCVTGVSGSGKSTLVDDILRRSLFRHFHKSKEHPGKHKRISGIQSLDKVVVIDQAPIGRTPRSNPATYTGAFGFIRSLFAGLPASKVRGYLPGRYSFNVKGGRCERCRGDGILRIEMHFLPDVYVTCEQCRGMRYNTETLEIRYDGKNIADVLAMTIDEALDFFRNIPTIARSLRTLSEVGLGYLQLGQSATTLSGGEAQRVKLSAELSKVATGRTMYLLDEPTTGLHFADVHRLLSVLTRLRDAGNTIVVIEHNLDVIKNADYIIDLGPEGGDEGGEVVACGTPETVARSNRSHTGQLLQGLL